MTYSKIVIDGNNLYERNYHVHTNTRKIEGAEIRTGGISGFLKSLKSLEEKFLSPEIGQVFILFDNCNSKITNRKEIDPDYKKDRKKKHPNFFRGLEILQFLLLNYKDNYTLLYRSSYEADDLVKPLLLSPAFTTNDRVLLVSEDMDWARLIGFQGREVYWYAKGKEYTGETFQEENGFLPGESSITLYKTFRGDDSDNIPVGCKGFREELLLRLMRDYTDIYAIFRDLDRLEFLGTWAQKMREAEGRLKLNFQLVSFLQVGREELSDCTFACRFQKETLKTIYKGLGFSPDIDDRILTSQPRKTSTKADEFFQLEEVERF